MSESIERSGAAAAGPQSGSRPKAKKSPAGAIIIGAALLAAGAGGYMILAARRTQSTDDATVKGDQVIVSAQLMGQITSLAAEERAEVSKDQVLATLDDQALRTQESQAGANRELAAQNVALAQVKLAQAKADLDRAAVQLKSKIIPQEQYDHLSAAEATAEAQLGIAQAQKKLADAQLASVETSLGHAVIRSPIRGVVAKKWTMVGNVAQPAQAIYTLYDLKRLWIEAYFKETQIRSLGIGDPAEISVDAFPGRSFRGKVESIGAATASEFSLIPPDNASGNFTKVTQRVPVRIALEDPDSWSVGPGRSLVPGLSVEVRVRASGG